MSSGFFFPLVHLDFCLWEAAEPKELCLSSRDQHGTVTICYTFVEVLDSIYISFLTQQPQLFKTMPRGLGGPGTVCRRQLLRVEG